MLTPIQLEEKFEKYYTYCMGASGRLRMKALLDFIHSIREDDRKERQQDVNSVLAMLDGDTDRVKIANYVREYLL